MTTILPKALKIGDEVRVIAPARSMAIISPEGRAMALERLEHELGLRVTFGRHVEEMDRSVSSSVAHRLEDLHDAFADKNVKAVLTVIGGFNSEELLAGINWGLIKNNPKIFCGFSDITTLSNAIYAKTGLVAFSGPHFSSFGMKKGFEYTFEAFKKAVMGAHTWNVLPSANWSNDAWYKEQEKREFIGNYGLRTLRPGKARGPIVGGNVSSFAILGKEFTPKLEGSILFVEEAHDTEIDRELFSRNFGALTRLPGFDKIKGLVIGRFEKGSDITEGDIRELLMARRPSIANRDFPVVMNADFGHTTPIFTFGIGGFAELDATKGGAHLTFEPFVKL